MCLYLAALREKTYQDVTKMQRNLGINLYNGENTGAKWLLKKKQTKGYKKKAKDDLGINFNNGGNTGAKCLKTSKQKSF